MDDLKERADALALQADEWEGKYAIASDMLAQRNSELHCALARIDEVKAQLAEARGEPDRIVAWLRNEDNAGDWPREWGVNRIEQIATAIAARAYAGETET